jgi:hypothetical protein
MDSGAVFSSEDTFAPPDIALLEEGAVFIFALGPGAETGVTADDLATFAHQFVKAVSRQLLKGPVHKNYSAIRVHKHQPLKHGIDHCFPIIAVYFL